MSLQRTSLNSQYDFSLLIILFGSSVSFPLQFLSCKFYFIHCYMINIFHVFASCLPLICSTSSTTNWMSHWDGWFVFLFHSTTNKLCTFSFYALVKTSLCYCRFGGGYRFLFSYLKSYLFAFFGIAMTHSMCIFVFVFP